MRNFEEREGRAWTASVAAQAGKDYKGRVFLVMRPADGSGPEVSLEDVRWNCESSARRTLETMSVVELRRRLRCALGRRSAPAGA